MKKKGPAAEVDGLLVTKDVPDELILLPALDTGVIKIRIVGDSPLVVHKWSEKAKKAIRDKQAQKASLGREKRNPKLEYEQSLYRLEAGGFGFPAIAFKKAAVTACTSLGRNVITKVSARQSHRIVGQMVLIKGKPKMREDVVRVANGNPDLRYRGEFWPWSTELTIRYNKRVISAEQLVNLYNLAGFGVGVGEGRVERDMDWGTFHVA